jgi:ABC-type multidrug transport system fused ATPase/permease subunit
VVGKHVNFSGGEEQLLDIARSLVKGAKIMLFDEATNQLDPDKEMEVFNLVRSFRQDRVIVFITHRMTVARKCDKIIVLDEGEVSQIGSHNELLSSGGLYGQFWHKQVIEG